tara:strand:+ start:2079 stop:2423 length:345 start_codon:yes stop_codon:yes gene_type:complete
MTKRSILKLSKTVPDDVRVKLAQYVDVEMQEGDVLLPESGFDASYARDVAAANQLRHASRQLGIAAKNQDDDYALALGVNLDEVPKEPGGECPVVEMEADVAFAHNVQQKMQKL